MEEWTSSQIFMPRRKLGGNCSFVDAHAKIPVPLGDFYRGGDV